MAWEKASRVLCAKGGRSSSEQSCESKSSSPGEVVGSVGLDNGLVLPPSPSVTRTQKPVQASAPAVRQVKTASCPLSKGLVHPRLLSNSPCSQG